MHSAIPLIPLWFYGFDSFMYLIVSLVGFVLSFNFFRIYKLSLKEKHIYLYLAFMLLSVGFLILSITNTLSYFSFGKCRPLCSLGLLDEIFSVEDLSYFLFFGLSLVSYIMFLFVYGIKDFKISKILVLMFILYLLVAIGLEISEDAYNLWYSYYEYFHLISFIMTAFISFKIFMNYQQKKKINSLLVLFSFILISFFHFFLLFSFVNEWIYVLAHISLLIGFSLFLIMVFRVKKNAKKKK